MSLRDRLQELVGSHEGAGDAMTYLFRRILVAEAARLALVEAKRLAASADALGMNAGIVEENIDDLLEEVGSFRTPPAGGTLWTSRAPGPGDLPAGARLVASPPRTPTCEDPDFACTVCGLCRGCEMCTCPPAKPVCTTPNGRTDSHGEYVTMRNERDAQGRPITRCAFCGEPV